MKVIFGLFLCLCAAYAMPNEEITRQSRQRIFQNFLGNIGILQVIPRSCVTDSAFMGKGMCSLESDCEDAGGAIAGSCERAGVCCVVPVVCGSTVSVKRSWFINSEFPRTISDAYKDDCGVIVQKSNEKVKQVRLDFEDFHLNQATNGVCTEDTFTVFRDGVDGEEQVIPVLCGDNTGQHVYIDMPPGKLGEIRIKVKVGKSLDHTLHRGWRILITQLDESEAAPDRCLQYYNDQSVVFKSLNHDSSDSRFIANADYDVCFKVIEQFRTTADSTLDDKTSFHICKRAFTHVNIQQSFSPSSKKSLNTRTQRATVQNRLIETVIDEETAQNDRVVSQISQVVSQLQAKNDKKQKLTNEIEKEPIKKNVDKASDWVVRKDGSVVAKKKTKPSSLVKEVLKNTGPNEVKLIVSQNANLNKNSVSQSTKEKLTYKPIKKVAKPPTPVKYTPVKKVTSNNLKKMEKNPVSFKPAIKMRDENVYNIKDAEEMFLTKHDCRGTYISVNDQKLCGTFFSSSLIEGEDERFMDANKFSIRSNSNPETTLRYSMAANVVCRMITTTTTTTTTTAAPLVVPISVNDSSNSTGVRRVGIFQYLFGLY